MTTFFGVPCPRWLHRARHRLRTIVLRQRVEDELERELLFHVDALTHENIDAGMTPEEARFAALRDIGNLASIQESCRDMRRTRVWDDLRQDVRFSWRSMRRNPAFTGVAVLTLATGIGATSAIFSVINAVLVRPLLLPTPDRWVTIIEHRPPSEPFDGLPARRPPYPDDTRDLKAHTRALSDVFLYGGAPDLRLPGREEGPPLRGAALPADAMITMGAKPAVGRLFQPAESESVMVLSEEAWARVFDRDPAVLGKTIPVDLGNVIVRRETRVYTVVGVVARGFAFPRAGLDYWIPGGRAFNVARLAVGVSLAAATSEVNTVMAQITRRPPRPSGQPPRYELVPLQEELVGAVQPTLRLLAIAVALVLMIACANVASLLLSRAVTRQREMSLRAALGAARGRLMRQALTETVVLATAGGVGGAILAIGGVFLIRRLLASFAPDALIRQVGSAAGAVTMFPRLAEIRVDGTTLLFSAVVSLASAVVFGLLPALRQTAHLGLEVLREGSASAVTGFALFRNHAARSVLVVAQIAFAVTLLASGGLVVRSAWKLLMVDKGFDPHHVLTFELQGQHRRTSVSELRAVADELTERLRRIPDVDSAAYAHQLPLIALQQKTQMMLTPGERLPPDTPDQPASVYRPDLRLVSRDYFRVMGMHLVAGHAFATAGLSTRTLVVSESIARARFGMASGVGRQVYLARDGIGADPWTVVGVVEDVRQQGLDRDPQPQVYAELSTWPGSHEAFDVPQYFAVRTTASTASLLPAIRRATRSVDDSARLDHVFWMDDLVSASLARPRTYAWLLGLFAGAGLLVAAIGIYGVMNYTVVQATRELGVRLALGADRLDIFALVLGRAGALVCLGVVVGLGGALIASRLVEGMLYGLTPIDPQTHAATVMLVVLVAAAAAYRPARNATRVDPVRALRYE